MYGEEQIRQWYGRPLCSSDVMPKILWIKNKEPDIYAKTHKFLTGSSFIAAKLTGNYVVDRFLGLASFNPLYFNDGTPNPETCLPICRPDQLAEVKEANDIAGYVTETASKETGLAVGTPVIVGTDDSGAEAISTGVVAPGKMMIQFGSSIYMILGQKNWLMMNAYGVKNLLYQDFVIYLPALMLQALLLNGIEIQVFPDALELEQNGGPDAYITMMQDLDKIPVGSDGLITLPYFAGERTPINDPLARGILFGLTLAHTRQHMYRSALESVAYSVNQQLKIMLEHDVPIDQIFAVGGGVKNDLWMQIVADVTGKEISTPAITVGASFGDALMAASGIKYSGFESFNKTYRFSLNLEKPIILIKKTMKHIKNIRIFMILFILLL